ncbi:RNA-binding domain-containing protein [Amniculicola lignicola CBS 123094]|uniref:Nucleolar protein 12 n=1 Tax=Amniculicola lignicola CBS 123094 TaxID=1392246 RepID=A0A6A5WF08_9PLEO|nr:RNA-binding domain-containing protein [Amniculicola lignicola CBS 123094]
MAKSAHNRPQKAASKERSGATFVAVDKKAFDPNLASLFASSLGPVTAPPKSRYQELLEKRAAEESSGEEEEEGDDNDAELSSLSGEGLGSDDSSDGDNDAAPSDDDASEPEEAESGNEGRVVLAKLRQSLMGEEERPTKKRKRANKEEDVEDVYMRKLVQEELKEEEKRKKKPKTAALQSSDEDEDEDVLMDSDGEEIVIPKHETQVKAQDDGKDEMDKAARTVFLGNVSSEAITSKTAKKTLMRHLASFIPDLADNNPPHKVESLRFRSTPFGSSLPKKAAFAKKEIMDSTTKSTNAYAVYTTQVAAREATKRLNGTIVLDRHLRVDWLAHPAPVDNRRCVFVGNLGFVDDESKMNEEDGKKSNRPPGDVEEGLWVHFSKAGKVESVRVIRDSQTRVSKGVAYVQFEDENGVEAALQYNEKKFPPLLPRKLRVTRAKNIKKKPATAAPRPSSAAKTNGVYNAKISGEQKSKQGRARAMLGKAGAFKSAESFIFEGHRASSKQGNSGLKLGGKNGKKKAGKPTNRGSKRASAWKASGGKK